MNEKDNFRFARRHVAAWDRLSEDTRVDIPDLKLGMQDTIPCRDERLHEPIQSFQFQCFKKFSIPPEIGTDDEPIG